ncbi:hypothetical protein [Parapedobacter sp. DT-150]|uniref:hypothetical protein n=1 Tax=Parapedobacter sp. DT-150 TaxID=3396162 RepID=UPI003F19AEEF
MNRFQQYLIPLAIGCALAACNGQRSTSNQPQTDTVATDVPSPTADSLVLIPGEAAGFISLGDADSVVLEAFGKPDFSDAAMGKAVLMWHTPADTTEYPLSVFTSRDMGNDETAHIKQIRITSPHFQTSQSIHVGSTLREISDTYSQSLHIVEMYKDGGEAYSVYDTDKGIAFEIDADNQCVAIVIHEKDATIPTYLPLRGQ